MKIVTLVENYVNGSALKAEHGLSIHISDDDGTSILFDAGLSEIYLQNAKSIGIDISTVDHFVLSHGHCDHSGGLPAFLKVNKKAKIHIKDEAFSPKYYREEIFVGMPELAECDGRIVNNDAPLQLSRHVSLIPKIAIEDWKNTYFKDLKVKHLGQLEADTVEEEQFLLIQKNDELSVLTACSHRGIKNILNAAQRISALPFDLILGGLHLIDSSFEEFQEIEKYFASISPKRLGLSHCTGIDAFSFLRSRFGERIFYNQTGSQVEI